MVKKLYKIFILPYTLFMLYLMFVGLDRLQLDSNEIRVVPILSTYNFLINADYIIPSLLIVVGNFVMFIPYGFLGWVFPKLKDLKQLLINFLSVIIVLEALQYFSRFGFFDIDDVIINTFGVFVGHKICKLFEQKFSRLVL